MFEDKNKSESFYHAALIVAGDLKIGSFKANESLKTLLEKHGSCQAAYHAKHPQKLFPDDDSLSSRIHSIEKEYDEFGDFQTIRFDDEAYPEAMREIYGVPPVLYVRGNPELMKEKSIAVVGTRDPERRDIEDGRLVMERLLKKEYVIVSGLARGCDAMAHRYAVDNRGKTIAVLGTPLNKYANQPLRELQDEIAEDHLLISQYPIGTRVFRSFFSHRNLTTVSLSSEGIVVIKAGDRSGTKHAMRSCIQQGKKIYVLPANAKNRYKWVEKYKDHIKLVKPKNGDDL